MNAYGFSRRDSDLMTSLAIYTIQSGILILATKGNEMVVAINNEGRDKAEIKRIAMEFKFNMIHTSGSITGIYDDFKLYYIAVTPSVYERLSILTQGM